MNTLSLMGVTMKDYVENIGWFSIIDLVVLCGVLALILLFFK